MTRKPGRATLKCLDRPSRPLTIPVETNLAAVRRRIERAAQQNGRSPEEVCLVAVTKSVTAAEAAALVRLGQLDLGENRVGELEHKTTEFARLGLQARWHFIGHLQANKVRRVVRSAAAIHAIDSPELLERVGRIAAEEGRHLQIYLQVALTGEAQKHGLAPADLSSTAALAARFPALSLCGLMAMGPAHATPELTAGAVFARARDLARELERESHTTQLWHEGKVRLSLGMSSDFELAIAAGSNLVRIGRALFAPGPAASASGPLREMDS